MLDVIHFLLFTLRVIADLRLPPDQNILTSLTSLDGAVLLPSPPVFRTSFFYHRDYRTEAGMVIIT